MIHERTERRIQSTKHYIESTSEEEVNARVEELFTDYPPEGYGTFHRNDVDAETGTFRAMVWHANSAE